MDRVFFSWLAAQSYSVEVAFGALFVVVIAPAVLSGMAALATWAERYIGDLLQASGLLDSLEREKKTMWRLRPHTARHLRHRYTGDEPGASATS